MEKDIGCIGYEYCNFKDMDSTVGMCWCIHEGEDDTCTNEEAIAENNEEVEPSSVTCTDCIFIEGGD